MLIIFKVRDEILEHFKRFDRDRHLNQLCAEDLEQLKNWRLDHNLTANYENFLTVQGWNDLKYMAIDFQRTFQKMIEPRYSKEKFRFGYSNSQRTEASYKAFVEGLFGPNAEQQIDTSPESNSSILLKPYDLCPDWNKEEDTAKNNKSEYYKFQQSDIFKQTLKEISTRLGFKYTLNAKQVDVMWDMCRYDQAWYLQDESPWCAAFTPSHVNVLEYLSDLKYFVKSGYGSELNSKIMCAAVQDMLKFIGSDTNPQVSAYFTHASAIQLFLTSLEYAKDDNTLRADNFDQMKYRKFKTSILSPFASNIAIVKYDCPSDPKRYKIQFFLNERPMNFEWCNIGLCDLEQVIEKYRNFLNADCSNLYCGGNSASSLYKTSFSILFIITLFLSIFK